MKENHLINEALEDLFAKNQKTNHTERAKAKLPQSNKRELELALAVLLVDLASSDQNFDMSEYNTIATGLQRIFGTKPSEIQALINQANLVIKNLRGTSKFAQLLRDSLDQEERDHVMSVIDEVISADGIEDGFETYLRHKFADLLGVQLKELGLKKSVC